jgi:hypothetical protein
MLGYALIALWITLVASMIYLICRVNRAEQAGKSHSPAPLTVTSEWLENLLGPEDTPDANRIYWMTGADGLLYLESNDGHWCLKDKTRSGCLTLLESLNWRAEHAAPPQSSHVPLSSDVRATAL